MILKYNAEWPDNTDPVQLELHAIRLGGRWKSKGRDCGEGLFFHYKQCQSLLWPGQDHHRWSDLALSSILENKVCGFLGPANSNKTYSASKYALIDYWAFPDTTCTLISSTDIRGLELRVWGAIKELFNEAKDKCEWLDGHVIDYLHTITTDEIDDTNRARVLRKGIICIPCMAGGQFVGLGKYVGIKQKRVRLISDEAQLMAPSFLDSTSNLGSNPDFKFIPIGNPIDPNDPLGMACEPEDGWQSLPEPTKTTVWKTRFLGGICVNFVGTDSPNYDFPPELPPKYPYLTHQRRLDEIIAFWTKDSQQYYSQGVGVMKTGLLSKRIITRDMCREHHALDKAVWGTSLGEAVTTRIYACDAAYGGVGGDRCVGGWGEFGNDINGNPIIRINPPVIIPVSIKKTGSPEDQIAEFIDRDSRMAGISSKNIFYDDTGRGTLGSAFARMFGTEAPVPVPFGGRPSRRPVRHDLYIMDKGIRRHKRCDEHYFDFVTELWWTVRYIIEAGQMRELPVDVMVEGCAREYGTCAGNKTFVESKHDPKARERMKRSPDLFDWLVTLVEGARQRGFQVQKLGTSFTENDGQSALDEAAKKHQTLWRKTFLNHR